MATAHRDPDVIDKIVDEALERVHKNNPEIFEGLTTSQKDKLRVEIRRIAEKDIALGEKLKHSGEDDVAKAHLPPEKSEMVKNDLSLWRKAILLDNHTKVLACIIIAALIFVLYLFGLKVIPSKSVFKKAVTKLVHALNHSPDLRDAANDLWKAWNSSSSSRELAVCLFRLLMVMGSCHLLWSLIEILCSSMSRWDYAKAAVLVAAKLAIVQATGGVAIIAQIAMAWSTFISIYSQVEWMWTLLDDIVLTSKL